MLVSQTNPTGIELLSYENTVFYYRGQPKAGTGHKMLLVFFVFSTSRFQGPAFGCDKIVVIVTLLEAIEDIPDKDYNFLGNERLGNDKFPNLYERLLHERKLKSRYLERRIYERPLKSESFIENQSEHISKLFLHQTVHVVKRKFIHYDF